MSYAVCSILIETTLQVSVRLFIYTDFNICFRFGFCTCVTYRYFVDRTQINTHRRTQRGARWKYKQAFVMRLHSQERRYALSCVTQRCIVNLTGTLLAITGTGFWNLSYGRHWGVVRRAMICSFRVLTWKARRVRNPGVVGFGLELNVKTV